MKLAMIASALAALQAATAERGTLDPALLPEGPSHLSHNHGICGNVRGIIRNTHTEALEQDDRRVIQLSRERPQGESRPKSWSQRVDDWLQNGFAAWPKYSGSPYYPVPCPESWMQGYAEWEADDNDLPDDSTEARWAAEYAFDESDGEWPADAYGDLRRELLAFLVQRAEAQQAAGEELV